MPTGTLTVADLQRNRFQSAAEFGLTTINDVLQEDLANYNRVLDEMLTDLAVPTTDMQRIYGAASSGEMYEADEFDRFLSQKPTGGTTVGFPLRKFGRVLGWTRDFFLVATPADIAEALLGIQAAHTRAVRRELQRAVFGATNYTWREKYVPPLIDLGVKRFVNADGAAIPNGPNSETFNGATHTHYDFLDSATPTNAALIALVDEVVEHGHGGRVRLNINRAAITAVRALANFVPLGSPLMTYRDSDTPTATLPVDQSTDNYMIGIFDGRTEVWVRSWVPAGYVFAYDAAGDMKPLASRQHPSAAVRGLRIVAQYDDYPLYAQSMESYFGFGAWNRTNGAVLYYASGAVAYVEPTFS